MRILILGYGFSGYYSAKKLLKEGHQVVAISRTYPKDYLLKELQHVCGDIQKININFRPDAILYCVPPPRQGQHDTLLSAVLSELERKDLIANIIYWGSSSVYGDHKGLWVSENSACHINSDLQRRRMDAEEQIKFFAKAHGVAWSIMRVSGMFGFGRMPSLSNIVINSQEAPYTNLVYIEDVADIAMQLLLKKESQGILNVSDGQPKKMGDLQRVVAKHLGETLIEKSYEDIMATASSMKRLFLSSSKRLSNKKCLTLLPEVKFSDFEKSVIQCLKK